MDARAAKLISLHERCILTRHATVDKLTQLAADAPPADLAADLPAEWLAELRRDCEEHFPCPPPGRMLFVSSVCNAPGYDGERERREWEDRWRAGLAAWQAFFGIGT